MRRKGAPRWGASYIKGRPMAEFPTLPIKLTEAIIKYNIGRSTFYRAFDDGTLTRYKFGGATFICERELIQNMTPAEAA